MLKVEYMKEYLYDRMIMNYGISAYTSENIRNCFTSFFDAVSRREEGKEKQSIIVLAVGINDSVSFKNTGNRRVEKDRFEQNIEALISECQKDLLVKDFVFLSATNVDEERINSFEAGEHFFYNADIEEYNNILKKSAERNSCGYIDVFGSMSPEDLEDGLHSNTQGHEKIYKVVKKYLETRI